MISAIQTAPAAKPPSLLAKFAGRFGVEPEKMLASLKATAFKGEVTNEQMMALLIVADQYGLNPWTKEIYAYPDKGGIVPVVGVDGWCRIINEHSQLDGIEFEYGPASKDGKHHEWVECVIFRKDRSRPTRAREFWSEVAKSTGPWQSHGNRMHRHKALIQCARIAFGFAGIYDADEAQRILQANHEASPEFRENRADFAAATSAKMSATDKVKAAARAMASANASEAEFVDMESGEVITSAQDSASAEEWAQAMDEAEANIARNRNSNSN